MALHNLTETAVQWVVSFKLQPQKEMYQPSRTQSCGQEHETGSLNLPWAAVKGKQSFQQGLMDR